MITTKSILATLRRSANPGNREGMERFGINPDNTLGVSMPVLRQLGKRIGRNHALALDLWKSGIHEARILAGLIDEPGSVTPSQMDRWARDFDSWDVCDQVCLNLFVETPYAHAKALAWSGNDREFVRRAGFALVACLAVHDQSAADSQFKKFFPAIKKASVDERNFVKKSVNWALRQIGKRNRSLNKSALQVAREIQRMDSRSARWIGADALRELDREAVPTRVRKKSLR